MHKRKIIFRVDGDSKIGLGHISRCCALADMLKDNFEIFFYTRTHLTTILDDLNNYCVDIFILNDTISYDEEAEQWVAALEGNEIIVLDGYNFNTNYQQKIKQRGCKLVCIDDIYAYHFVADAIINHAPSSDKKKYSFESYTKLYLGTDYVLLKKIFLEEALKQQRSFNAESSSVLICFGGSDLNNVTREVLEEIMDLFQDRTINVVVGAAYLHFDEMGKLVERNVNIVLHKAIKPDAMLELMKQSHIAVTSASTVALEYTCIKGNLFLKCTAENQKDVYRSLIEKKCAYSLADIKNNYQLNNLNQSQQMLIDGKSSNRLLNIFLNLIKEL